MNNTVINRLRTEHSHMRSVLTLVRHELERLEHGLRVDDVLLGNALYYMRKFPSVVHHPKEDMLFERLAERDPSMAVETDRLLEQHQEIYRLEDRLAGLVDQLAKGDTGVKARILEFGRLYLDIQRRHAETEEKLIFPRALEEFTATDWKPIKAKAEHIEDPLFGNHLTERYQSLYDYIMKESAEM